MLKRSYLKQSLLTNIVLYLHSSLVLICIQKVIFMFFHVLHYSIVVIQYDIGLDSVEKGKKNSNA